MDYSHELNIVTEVLISERGRQRGKDGAMRYGKDSQPSADFEGEVGATSDGIEQPPEAGLGKEMDSPLESPDGAQPYLTLAQRPIQDI